MGPKNFKYIYGPVTSWRLGSSLGIDLLSQISKICSFDCIYCQLGLTPTYTRERGLYVPTEKIVEELELLPEIQIDYITLSGRGEPTLALNLGPVIKAVKTIRKEPIAVLTNSSLMNREDVRKELSLANFVIVKLDTYSHKSFQKINRPGPDIKFSSVLNGIKEFKKKYQGKLALQIMFIKENKNSLAKFIYLTNYIKPDEVQINTPLRPSNIKPLSKEEILNIKECFLAECKSNFNNEKLNIISVYDDRIHKEVFPISDEDTMKRRGKGIGKN